MSYAAHCSCRKKLGFAELVGKWVSWATWTEHVALVEISTKYKMLGYTDWNAAKWSPARLLLVIKLTSIVSQCLSAEEILIYATISTLVGLHLCADLHSRHDTSALPGGHNKCPTPNINATKGAWKFSHPFNETWTQQWAKWPKNKPLTLILRTGMLLLCVSVDVGGHMCAHAHLCVDVCLGVCVFACLSLPCTLDPF